MSHYFDEDPSTPSAPRQVTWMLPDGPLSVVTDRGVFGYGQVDAGTKLLLVKSGQPPLHGDLLDLGCGSGVIALTMARRAPAARVWAIDVNARARQLCLQNAAANGVTNVLVHAPEEVPADVRFAAIWSNPPIRIGKVALHAVLLRWLSRLTPTGEALLVVHKHLGADSLQRWLGAHGFTSRRTDSSAGFRLLRTSPHGIDLDTQP